MANLPQVRGQSRDLAAEKSGLGSGKTYEAAKTVVDSGVPELITAMDSGKGDGHCEAIDLGP